MQIRFKFGIFKPKVFIIKQKINALVVEPTSIEQALWDPNWTKAMNNECKKPNTLYRRHINYG